MDNLTTSSGRPAIHSEIIKVMQTWHFPLASRISGCSRCDAFWAAREALISELAR